MTPYYRWVSAGLLLVLAVVLWSNLRIRTTPDNSGNAQHLAPVRSLPAVHPPEGAVEPAPFVRGSRAATLREFRWLSAEQLDDGRRFIRVDIAALHALEVGHSFQVDTDGSGAQRPALVEGEQWFDDVRRLTGTWWDEQGQVNSFGFTLSSDGTYVAGSFNDVAGQRVFEALNDAGWLQEAATAGAALAHDMPAQ